MSATQHHTAATVGVEQLQDAVLRVARLVPTTRPVMPLLAGIKIVFASGMLRFEAGDYLWAGFAEVPAETTTTQTTPVLVDGARLARVVRRAPGDAVTLIAECTMLELTSQNWTARLIYMPVEDYPDWSSLLTGAPVDDDDERTYGNSAETVRPLPPDGVDRALRGKPIKPEMWKGPSSKRALFQPAAFDVGDWVEFVDDQDQVHLGQVWTAASAHASGTLIVLRADQQIEVWPFAVSSTRGSRSFHTWELRDDQEQTEREHAEQQNPEPRTVYYRLHRAGILVTERDAASTEQPSRTLAA